MHYSVIRQFCKFQFGKLATVETFWALVVRQSNSMNVVSVPNLFLYLAFSFSHFSFL